MNEAASGTEFDQTKNLKKIDDLSLKMLTGKHS